MPAATAERSTPATAALVVFGVLVAATVGAFFVTQRLKRSTPIVRRVHVQRYISPNGDGRKDVARLSFFVPKRNRLTVSIVTGGGDEVRRLADDHLMRRGARGFIWDGRDDAGHVARTGTYFLRVALPSEGRAATIERSITLSNKAPRPRLVSVAPAQLPATARRRRVRIAFRGPSEAAPVYSVYRTDGPRGARLVDRFTSRPHSHGAVWNGRDRSGRAVPQGTYAFAVTVENRALVAGSTPAQLPPAAATAAPHTGVTIAGVRASGPLEPVAAGRPVRIAVSGASGRLRWSLLRVGGTRAVAHGRGRVPALAVKVPSRAATGLYAVRVRAPAGVASVPLAVRGGATGRRVLVVLPAMTWQGANPVDGDADGFPDTLADAPAVALARPFAGGRLPPALRAETAPLLAFLDSRHDRYDLTTDLALANGRGPRPAGHRGVLVAGSDLWLTARLDAQLRAYVDGGGRLASFGAGAFRRTVRATRTALTDPSGPERTNVFGEQTAASGSEAAPLVVDSDRLGLFSGTDGFVGLFTRFEQQQALVAGARVESAAGRDPKHPAFVAYRLARGTVVRVGTPQWARALPADSEVQAVTEATWRLLSR